MPHNGFKHPTRSRCNPWFIQTYLTANVAHCEKNDTVDRVQIAARMAAREQVNEGRASPLDRIAAMHAPIFNIWRTDAELRNGSLRGLNPYASYCGRICSGLLCATENWFSNWSGLSSNASMIKCRSDVIHPTLLIRCGGDSTVFARDFNTKFDASCADDKEHLVLPCGHHNRPVSVGAAEGLLSAWDACWTWLKNRFQTHER